MCPANVQTMAYVKKDGVPWHGLGTSVENIMTAEEALSAAGLSWGVIKTPVYAKHKDDSFHSIQDKFCIMRDDNESVIGNVGSVYTPVQNKDAFSFFDAVVGEKLAMYHTAGALGNGERIWLMAKLPKEIVVAKNDVVNCYLLLVNSHDGTSCLKMLFSPIRTVCENTLKAALSSRVGDEVNLRHCSDIGPKVQQARDTLGLAVKYYNVFEEVSKKFVEKKLVQVDVEEVMASIGLDDKSVGSGDEEKARKVNIRERILQLYESGKGNAEPDVKGSLWALINGVAEYTDHFRSTRIVGNISEAESRLGSQWFGSGALMKQKVFTKAMAMIK